MFFAYGVGDSVVCIRGFSEAEKMNLLVFNEAPKEWPQVAKIYVVEDITVHPRAGCVGVQVVEIPKWYWEPSRFRKVINIEEPKRLIETQPKELEPV